MLAKHLLAEHGITYVPPPRKRPATETTDSLPPIPLPGAKRSKGKAKAVKSLSTYAAPGMFKRIIDTSSGNPTRTATCTCMFCTSTSTAGQAPTVYRRKQFKAHLKTSHKVEMAACYDGLQEGAARVLGEGR
ncbi:hypothetical protein KIPB_010926, partial [Kipferlia bialata]|eukprot:g10926.t1